MEPQFLTTVHKNGSSYAVVVPKAICRALKIERGDRLAVLVTKKGVVELYRFDDFIKKRKPAK